MSTRPEDRAPERDGDSSSPRVGHDGEGNDTSGAGPASTDAARGQPDHIARTGGDPSADNRTSAPFEPATSSQGSRTGSTLGAQSERTGMGDGAPTGSSQGLAIEERSDGGPLRPAK